MWATFRGLMIHPVLLLFALLACAYPLRAQTFSNDFKPFTGALQHYICYQVSDSIRIDGLPDETSWQRAPWTENFQDIEGKDKPAPLHRTRVKMLWDARFLYILAELEEPHVWASLRQHDTIIFQDNDFEVFIDPDGDAHQYYEIEINALNTVMDLFMPKPYRNGGGALLNWDTKGLRTAVHINGTLNNATDQDSSWTVEMAIPFRSVGFFHSRIIPQDSTIWRINFSRVQWDTEVRNGQYFKRPHTPEHNWVWSPQGIINMHAPERWGYLQFSKSDAPVVFREPETAAVQNVLWEVYYRQQQYRRQHRHYAMDARLLQLSAVAFTPAIEATSRQFTATIRHAGFITIINQEGKITSHHE